MESLSWKRLLRAASAGPLLQVRKLRMWPRGAAASERLPGSLPPHAGASSHLWAAALDLCRGHIPQASGRRCPPPLTLLPASYKDTCDSMGPIWIIHESPPVSKSLLTSAESFLSHKVTNSQLPTKICGHLWEAVMLLTTLREKLSSGLECSGP